MKRRGLLITLVLSLAIPELALQLTDPFQVKTYFNDLAALYATMRADATRTYVLTPGVQQLSNWSMSVNVAGLRVVPDARPSDCTIVFVGDSVTMGYGVNDSDTWVNIMAQRFPDVQIVNAGIIGYNAAQAYATIQTVPAAGYFYTLVWNDADTIIEYGRSPVPAYMPLLFTYLWIRLEPFRTTEHDYAAFDAAIESMKAMSNVEIVGFEGDEVAVRAGVQTVPWWIGVNGPLDGHANAAGNVEIANAMMPYVTQLIEAVCQT